MPDDPSNPASFPSQLESVLADILQHEEEGRVIDVEGYCRSFPELAGPLRDYFRNREHFARLAPVLAPTPALQRADPEGQTGPPSSFLIGCRFGGYEILEELGRGGMGIVYRARQLRPERQVALKIIPTDRLEPLPAEERRQWLERFRREAQMVAALDQPDHIITLYEVGEEQGRPYFTMRLLPGGTLADHLKPTGLSAAAAAEQRVRGQRDSAQLLAPVARAVHYAHQRGILHRDLKPGNILLDENGRPLVSDFGLARRLDQTGSLVSAGIEGTAPYMSPEQAALAPGAVTTAADVYSLGAILYECLTGQPPFKGNSDVETLLQVLHQEVTPPRQHNRRLDGDLETICLKCLQKEPEQRYPSAAALADDLDNWLAGRPINARPVGPAERLWRWCRRNPALAGSLTFAAVALLAFALVAAGFAIYRDQANRELDERNLQLNQANGDLGESNRQLGQANSKLGETNRKLDKAVNDALSANEKLRREKRAMRQMTAGLELDRGRAAWQAGDASQGLLWMTQSLMVAPEDDAALQEAIRINLAGWRATLPPSRPPLRHPGIAARVRFSPDGSKIIVLSTGRVGLEDRNMPDGRKGKLLVARPETTADPFFDERWSFGDPSIDLPHQPPRRPRATPRGQVFLWDAASHMPLQVKPPPNSQVLAVSPDGTMVLAAKRQDHFSTPTTVQVWSLAEGKPVGEPVDLPPIEWAFCSGDGKTFAGLVRDRLVLWDVATGKRVKDFPVPGRHPYRLEQSTDGNTLAILTTDPFTGRQFNPESFLIPREGAHGAIKVYDLARREQVTDLPAGPSQKIDLHAAMALGPGARFVLLVSPSAGILGTRMGAVRLWDRQKNRMSELPYLARLTLAQLSPDGKLLLTASGRGLDHIEKVQLWETETGQPHGAPLLPSGLVRHAAFSPDGKLLAISSGEGEVQLWETGTGRPVARALRHPVAIHAMAFSPDSTKLVTGGHDGLARLWNLRSGPVLQPLGRLERVALVAADGSRYLQRSEGNTLRLHDMLSGEPCGKPVPCSDKDHAVALGPDRRTLFVLNEATTARLWNAETGKPIGAPLELYDPLTGVRFSRDGRTVLTFKRYRDQYGQWPMAYRWDTATGKALGQERNPNISMAAALSPDGLWSLRTLGNAAVIVDIKSTSVEGNRLPHPGPVSSGVFSPDSRTLLTVAASSGSWEEARLWDRASARPLGPPMPHQGLIRARIFSPDGKLVLTGSDDGTARLWDAATGKPYGPVLSHGAPIRAVAFHPDGKLVVTAGEDSMARLWHVATGRPLGPPLPHPTAVSFVTFGPGGETLIVAAGDRVGVWKVPQALAGEAKHLLLRAEIETGMELDGSTPRLLDDAERLRRRQQLDEEKLRKN